MTWQLVWIQINLGNPENYLEVEIVYLDTAFEWYDINDEQLSHKIRNEILNNMDDINYLLLLGNEINIPPIYSPADTTNSD